MVATIGIPIIDPTSPKAIRKGGLSGIAQEDRDLLGYEADVPQLALP